MHDASPVKRTRSVPCVPVSSVSLPRGVPSRRSQFVRSAAAPAESAGDPAAAGEGNTPAPPIDYWHRSKYKLVLEEQRAS